MRCWRRDPERGRCGSSSWPPADSPLSPALSAPLGASGHCSDQATLGPLASLTIRQVGWVTCRLPWGSLHHRTGELPVFQEWVSYLHLKHTKGDTLQYSENVCKHQGPTRPAPLSASSFSRHQALHLEMTANHVSFPGLVCTGYEEPSQLKSKSR